MSDRIRKRTKYLTVSSMLSALGVILLALGAMVDVLDITTAVLASMLCIYAVIEMGGAYPWLIWLVTSVLGLLLLPVKTPALFYALFAGFYPILKEHLEKIRRPISDVLKLAVFHVCLFGIYLALKLFFPSVLSLDDSWWLIAGTYALCIVAFVVYDIALTRLISFYLFRLRNRFRIR